MSLVDQSLFKIAAIMRSLPFRGKSVIWNQLQKNLERDEQVVVEFPQGYKFRIDLREYWQRQMMAACYDRREYWILSHLSKPHDTFFDVGANMGYYTLAIASKICPGKVYAFEPHPRMAKQLRGNVELNPHLSIEVHEIAISDQAREVTFFLPADNGWQSVQGSLLPMENGTEHRVQSQTLDEFIKQENIQKVQLCKMDIEGIEPAALKGVQRSLSSGVLESLSVEVTEETREEIYAFMDSFGFKTVINMRTWASPTATEKLRDGMTNVLWLRGACEERWKKISWQKHFN